MTINTEKRIKVMHDDMKKAVHKLIYYAPYKNTIDNVACRTDIWHLKK